MEYTRTGNTLIVRLDPKDEVIESLYKIAEKENILCGSIQALGASDEYDVSVYDLKEKKYYSQEIRTQSEITSLFGTITEKDGKPYFHVHMQAMTKNGEAAGGHLLSCVISATMEMVITVIDANVSRQVDPNTGLTIMKF